ncbi:MAG: ABC transporter substrate-binding protein [Deltaproteobacteria bacterium]|nr:ABC transporter substrate-binding protein [Deltaproteobacteria bacterium]MBI2347597.1 ABC transporter substrate-binding protein [Deltaproteobacteria bacterium]
MHVLAGIFALAALLFSAGPAGAQEKVRVAWAGASPANSPIWVVQEKGFLKKQGLDAEVISITASPIALQAMLAGELDVIVTSVTTLVSSRLAGADIVMILGMVPTFVDHIITLPSITRVEHLKGKTGGVNRIGSTSDLGLRLALRKLGVDPEKEAKIITSGGNPERFAALSKGVVQFTIMPEPFVREAEKLGFKDFLDIGSLKIPFWWNAVLTRESIIKAKRPAVLKFARAMTEALHFLKTEKEASKQIFSKNLRITDPESLERAYRAYSVVFPEAPYPTPEGVKTMLDDLAPRNPKAAAADPKSFVDMSLVQQLEKEGFIKQLYRK